MKLELIAKGPLGWAFQYGHLHGTILHNANGYCIQTGRGYFHIPCIQGWGGWNKAKSALLKDLKLLYKKTEDTVALTARKDNVFAAERKITQARSKEEQQALNDAISKGALKVGWEEADICPHCDYHHEPTEGSSEMHETVCFYFCAVCGGTYSAIKE